MSAEEAETELEAQYRDGGRIGAGRSEAEGGQACISVWQQFGYLFSVGGSIGGELHRSDTNAIADALLLPYWFWGAAISAVIVVLLWWSFAVAFRR